MSTINTTIRDSESGREIDLTISIHCDNVDISAKGYGAIDEWSQLSIAVLDSELRVLVWSDKNEVGEPTHVIEMEPARRDPSDEPKYENHYDCPCGTHWEDESPGVQDDRCPQCGTSCSPTESLDLPEKVDMSAFEPGGPLEPRLVDPPKVKGPSKPGDNPCLEIVLDADTCQLEPPMADPDVLDPDAEIDFSNSANFIRQGGLQGVATGPTGSEPTSRGDEQFCVAVSVVARNPAGETLLGFHERLGGLAFPGGKARRGESLYETAYREFAEETGIVIERPVSNANGEMSDGRMTIIGIEQRTDINLMVYLMATDLTEKESATPLVESEPAKFHDLRWLLDYLGSGKDIAVPCDQRAFHRLTRHKWPMNFGGPKKPLTPIEPMMLGSFLSSSTPVPGAKPI